MKRKNNGNGSVLENGIRITNQKELSMNMKKKKITSLFALVFFALLFVSIITGASGGATPDDLSCRLAPLSPGFLKYIDACKNEPRPTLQSRVAREDRYPLGGVPSPVDLSHVRGPVDDAVNSQYPAYYDLRILDRVTPMKNQRNYPTCWAFAAFTSLESCLIPDETVDFSEWHLVRTHGFDYSVDAAGNSFMTTAYLTRWSGPLDENDFPYGGGSNINAYYVPAKHVQQVVFLPEREGPLDNNTIKYFVVNEGPVDFAYNWEFDNFLDTENTIYTPNNGGENHRLAIVGWDDNFPASRFMYRPQGNGAFIARNSWGDQWGERGYCYISYYDNALQHFTSFNNAEDTHNYGTIYQYDPLGYTRTWGTRESWGANVFLSNRRESLEAVGFYAVDSNMNYEIQVYKHINPAGNSPVSGTLSAVKTGALVYGGFYTVRLDDLVSLEQGEYFSTAVKFTASNYNYSVPIEAPIMHHSSAASANPGESYVSEDGIQWTDLTQAVQNSNVCIKAYTEYVESIAELRAIRKTLNGWLVSRDYADITITVTNLDEAPLSKLILYRSLNSPTLEVLLEIAPTELVNGSFHYQDKYIGKNETCTYQVVAVDTNGLISGKSDMVSI